MSRDLESIVNARSDKSAKVELIYLRAHEGEFDKIVRDAKQSSVTRVLQGDLTTRKSLLDRLQEDYTADLQVEMWVSDVCVIATRLLEAPDAAEGAQESR